MGVNMASLGDTYAALPAFRVALQEQQLQEGGLLSEGFIRTSSVRNLRTPFSGNASPIENIHATGIGIRVRNGKIIPDDFVLKVYVFDKTDLGADTPDLTRKFEGVDVDVEPLPVQLALAKTAAKTKTKTKAAVQQAVPANRSKQRPVVGGLSIAPINVGFVGTLGCFVKRRMAGSDQIFALSNNHVLADTDGLPVGTLIVQPGPETEPSSLGDAFASLSETIPIRFPRGRFSRETNRFDAAIARVNDLKTIKQGTMFGINNYDPTLSTPQPGMEVIKSGRTTGTTRGVITATGVNGVQVNYGTLTNPIIATFNDTIEIVGDGGDPFSLPGDSGSIILERSSGRPVGLLFAGDGHTTTACSIAGVCRHFQVLPI
jgi:hypothetical protein